VDRVIEKLDRFVDWIKSGSSSKKVVKLKEV